MELSPEHLLDQGGQVPLLFSWRHGVEIFNAPPEVAAVCFVVMRRNGGLLLALPASAIEEEVLIQHSQGVGEEEPLVGPYVVQAVQVEAPSVTGEFELLVDQCEVLLVDMSLPSVAHLLSDLPGEEGLAGGQYVGFYELDAGGRPSLEALLQAAKSWLAAETQERLAFYSAEEGLQTPLAKGKAPAPGGFTTPGSKRSSLPKAPQKKPTVASLAAQMETIAGSIPLLVNQVSDLMARQEALEKGAPKPAPPMASFASRASMPVSALLGSPTAPLAEAVRMAGPPPKTRNQNPQIHAKLQGFSRGRPSQIGWRSIDTSQPLCTGTLGTEQGFGGAGCPLSSGRERSYDGVGKPDQCSGSQRSCGPREVAAGAFVGDGPVFPSGSPIYEPAYVAYISASAERSGSGLDFHAELPGEVWRFWAKQRNGSHYVVLGPRLRCSSKRRVGSGEGPFGPDMCDAGSGQPRSRGLMAVTMASPIARRSAIEFMAESEHYCNGNEEGLRPSSVSKLGDHRPRLCQGIGSPQLQEARSKLVVVQTAEERGKSCRSKTKAKEEALGRQGSFGHSDSWAGRILRGTKKTSLGAKASSRDQEGTSSAWSMNDGVSSPSGDPLLLDAIGTEAVVSSSMNEEFDLSSCLEEPATMDFEKISFGFTTWCHCLPRWVLRSRTAFGRYLSKTFHLSRDGPPASPTALFPLPLPFENVAAALAPGQQERSPYEVAVDKALHVIISALNYIYCASSFPDLQLIRRQPNSHQRRAIEHIRLLLRACDPGQLVHIESSGRKNLQLLARLQELAQATDALGLSGSPYSREKSGRPVPKDDSVNPKLSPFSSLKADRLKISGNGHWDAAAFMGPELEMSFCEPQVIELERAVFSRGRPNLLAEKPDEVLKLFRRWDQLGLLVLHSAVSVGGGADDKVKIFNAYKSSQWDRQIGDRRLRNAVEGRIPGPSKELPCGPLITRLCIPEGCGLKVCVTDRSDFYHQMGVTLERSKTNCIWPPMPLACFQNTQACREYLERQSKSGRQLDRNVHGDLLHGGRPAIDQSGPEATVFGAFKSVLQGDHLGVEYGIDAHAGFLKDHGLLADEGRLLSSKILKPAQLYEGLVIDDYFSLAVVPEAELEGDAVGAESDRAFRHAKKAYDSVRLAGSDPKDVVNATRASVVGAEVDSRPHVVREGILPVGAPALKRLSLSWIALTSARFGYTSDALHSSLTGSLVSAFCFRKCSMAIIKELFKVIPPTSLNVEKPVLHALSRKAAEELVLAGVLLPILVTDVKSPILPKVFASDASLQKGAFCEADVSPQMAMALWQSGDFRGGHSFLDSAERSMLKKTFGLEEEDLKDHGDDGAAADYLLGAAGDEGPQRPLAQHFDFLEVCGGSGVLSEKMSAKGFVVGPIIDLSYSRHYDLTQGRTLEWLLFLVQNGRVRLLALEPPCTTFSPAAHPMVRSYKQPRGFCQKSSKVWIGNKLAFACITLLRACAQCDVMAWLENPRRSKMAWLTEWRRALELPTVRETYTASCSFGSPFQKEFRFLTANMWLDGICRPCTRDHFHVKIQGSLTKGSAVYCDGLAEALAVIFGKHLNAELRVRSQSSIGTDGLESFLTNEASWRVSSSWKWNGSSHINILELACVLQVAKRVARDGGGRAPLLLDSNVALRASAKGRSSSKALAPLLRKILAVSLAFAVFLAGLFCPTRLNPSDDPTRDVPLREPCRSQSVLDFCTSDELFVLASQPRLRRWTSNWVILVAGLFASAGSVPLAWTSVDFRKRSSGLPLNLHRRLLDFDSTLGFPGEGPFGVVFWVIFSGGWWLEVGVAVPSHGMRPRNGEDLLRAERRSQKPLMAGRPVLPATRNSREKLVSQFSIWLREAGYDLDELLDGAYRNPELLVKRLTEYGSQLYDAGRPYNHYAETINGLASLKPTIRRLMAGAWDLAFTWLREEPYEHHLACPYQVLLGALTLAIIWGWPRVAAVLALTWGSVCRIGEVLGAIRKDLILPEDTGFAVQWVMLRVGEPKTRFRAARHQMARLDWQDLAALVTMVFARVDKTERLWPWSSQLLRTRFKQLLHGLKLPAKHGPRGRPLDLGSLRAGGATHLLLMCEDAELVRRRGRWISSRTMEIYLQEAQSTVFFPQLDSAVKAHIMTLACAFPAALRRMRSLLEGNYPYAAWPFFMQSDPFDGKDLGGDEGTCGHSVWPSHPVWPAEDNKHTHEVEKKGASCWKDSRESPVVGHRAQDARPHPPP